LSVSISSSGSPFDTLSPSLFRQATSLPVSCAISRAGITTLKAMVSFSLAIPSVAADSHLRIDREVEGSLQPHLF
jgi:hypothetical protein